VEIEAGRGAIISNNYNSRAVLPYKSLTVEKNTMLRIFNKKLQQINDGH